jgi:hypothetical protein
MTATDRVRKHRAKLRTEQCSRLDVWIASWIVERGSGSLPKRRAVKRGQRFKTSLNNTQSTVPGAQPYLWDQRIDDGTESVV